MKLTNLIKTLGSFEPDGYPFISLYLNAEANETGRENYPVWLKKELSEKRNLYKDNPAEAEGFEKVVEKINTFVDEEADPAANGIAIFAGLGGEQVFEVVQLAVPFRENQMFVYDRPHLFPLVRAVYQNPKYAVLF